jgi:hypothetical protein
MQAENAMTYETLEGYTVVFVNTNTLTITDDVTGERTILPRAFVQDSDVLSKGDRDIIVARWLAIKNDLRF